MDRDCYRWDNDKHFTFQETDKDIIKVLGRTFKKGIVMSDADSELLARIDERTQTLEKMIKDVKHTLELNYVTQEEFKPIRIFVYGVTGISLLSMAGALISLIMHKA